MEITNISLIYLLIYLGKRILNFFEHWYVDGFLKAVIWSYSVLESLDQKFALRITAKNWFQPLYQDYSLIGHILGFIFRTIRIIVALFVYAFFTAVSVGLFLAWSSIPIFVIYKIVINF